MTQLCGFLTDCPILWDITEPIVLPDCEIFPEHWCEWTNLRLFSDLTDIPAGLEYGNSKEITGSVSNVSFTGGDFNAGTNFSKVLNKDKEYNSYTEYNYEYHITKIVGDVVSAVPLPLGGLLLIGALGALGAVGWRKKSDR